MVRVRLVDSHPGLEKREICLIFSLGTTLEDDLAVDRGLVFDIDCTNYTQLFILAIAGNDFNGGERLQLLVKD